MNFYYNDPRLSLSFFSRRFVKIVIGVVYIVLFALLFVFLLSSGLSRLRWLGILLGLFLLDRFLHLRFAERSLIELKKTKSEDKINLACYLTPSAYNLLEESFERACFLGGELELWFLKNLLERAEIKEVFRRLEVSLPEFLQKLEEYLHVSFNQHFAPRDLLPLTEKLVMAAAAEAILSNESFIEPRNFLPVLLFNENQNLRKLFEIFAFSSDDLKGALIFSRYRRLLRGWRRSPTVLGGFVRRPFNIRQRTVNRAWTSRPTPVLDQFGFDLTEAARREKIGFLIGHEMEYERLVNVISRSLKPAALLVGEPGVGKSALVNHLAYQIAKDRVLAALFDKRLVSLEMGKLTAYAEPAELSGRLQKIIEEIIQAGNIILFIPDLDNLVKSSGEHFLNAADILLPAIKAGAFPVIGATYPREFRQFIEPQSDLAAAFEIISVEEINEADAVKILVYESLLLEREFRVEIKYRAVKQAVVLARRYLRVKPLPSSAEDVLRGALLEVQERGQKVLTADIVKLVVERRVKIPIQTVGPEETEKLLNLETLIHRRLINQEEAVKAVSGSLREYRSGLARAGGPIAVFLFVGPTGVGKTELAKILAEIQFGSRESMFRFDMSEYQDKQSIFRFIGSPQGEISGSLTEAVRQNPFCLLLLDEFEKAHPDILNLFLQVFDDGRLTDNLGRLVDFQNTIIIATSNAHSEFIKNEIEKGTVAESLSAELKKKLSDYFKPELINRFSRIIVFRSLRLEEITAVARLQINDLSKTIKETHGIELLFDEAALQKIAELGFDPVFGARPLRQVISDKIRNVLAEKILRQEIGRGNSLKIVWEKDKFEFQILS